MIIRLNLTRKEIKGSGLITTNPKKFWVAYFKNPKLKGVAIHTMWISDQVENIAKICTVTGITVKIYDEFLSTELLIKPIDFKARVNAKGELPQFSYHSSDEHAAVYKRIAKFSEENRIEHFKDIEVGSDVSYAQSFKELKFDKNLGLKRLKLFVEKYNALRSELHDRTFDVRVPQLEDITYLSAQSIEAQVEALTLLFQLERPHNKYEGEVNRIHGLYLLSQYIDPDLSDLENNLFQYRKSPQLG